MGEEVEELEAGWVDEVGGVGVSGEFEVGVGGIGGVDFGCEVPEAAVVGDADGGEVGEERFGSFGCGWGIFDETEAELMDLRDEGLEL